MFHLVVLLTAHGTDEAEQIALALARMRGMCVQEPGCVRWEALRSQGDPRRFVLVERWASRAHWEAHGDMAAIREVYLPEIVPRASRDVLPCDPLATESRL